MISAPDGTVLFTSSELACKDSGLIKLHTGFADHLRDLRLTIGYPMIVTSCCRSAEHNKAVGGHSRSLHVYDKPNHGATGTAAIDIKRGNAAFNTVLVQMALKSGWSIGVSKTFIHLDRRTDLGMSQNIFGY
ncbi:MAG: D-Ala-D-Ala carboxypeptidase family metallohydrolase [Bacteroidetes bacterium]|nr:D-Ala-D-Ala carboxypeptidase family metallohydrolase [Bacteroidota bacterium]